jgi:hypothetical protein
MTQQFLFYSNAIKSSAMHKSHDKSDSDAAEDAESSVRSSLILTAKEIQDQRQKTAAKGRSYQSMAANRFNGHSTASRAPSKGDGSDINYTTKINRYWEKQFHRESSAGANRNDSMSCIGGAEKSALKKARRDIASSSTILTKNIHDYPQQLHEGKDQENSTVDINGTVSVVTLPGAHFHGQSGPCPRDRIYEDDGVDSVPETSRSESNIHRKQHSLIQAEMVDGAVTVVFAKNIEKDNYKRRVVILGLIA